MNSRVWAAIAVAIAVAFGAIGYVIGTGGARLSDDQRAEVDQAIETALEQERDNLAATSVAAGPAEPDALSEGQRGEVETLIRDHLIANPEIIAEAINALQSRQEEQELAARVAAITDNADVIFSSERQVVLGNPEGDVTLVEFFDYNCGFCRRAMADLQTLMDEDPELRVVLKEFPVLGEGSIEAARVSVAVSRAAPDKFLDFHFALMSERGQVNGERALAVADGMGIDAEALKPLIESDEVRDTLNEVYEIAGKLNLSGTPTFVTAGEVVVGAVGADALRKSIADVRAN